MKPTTKRELVFSQSFLNFLEKIKKQSTVARIIISCITLKLNKMGHIADHVLTGEDVSFITFRRNGLISFMPAGKEQLINEDGTWKMDGRQEGKPSKVIRKVFTKNALKVLNEKDFEIFNNKYKAEFVENEQYEFVVHDRDYIPGIYDYDFRSNDGSIGSSCMNDDGDLVNFYTRVPGLRIVTLIDKTKINDDGQPLLVGRALLWQAKRVNDDHEITFLDRLYVAADFMYEMFVNYAVENGWWTKVHIDTYQYKKELINPSTGERETHELYVPMDVENDEGPYPYIDTFTYAYSDRLLNFNPPTSSIKNTYRFGDTEGKREIWDPSVNSWNDEENMVEVVYGCYAGRLVDEDGVIYSNFHDGYILRSEAFDVDGEIYHENYVQRVA